MATKRTSADDRRSRLRMNREEQQQVAKKGAWDSGSNTVLCLPEGIEEWKPKEAKTYYLRFLPYEITKPGHPDKLAVGKGHYRRPYGVHFDIGGSGEAVVCPKESFGDRDVICDRIRELAKNYKENEDAIKALRASRWCLFSVIDVKADPTKIYIYNDKFAKFAKVLEKKLAVGEPEDLDFANPNGGSVLAVTFTQESFGGHDYLQAFQIEIKDGKSMADLSDDILERCPNLDDCLITPDPLHIAELFSAGGDGGGAAGGASEWEGTPPAKPGKGKPAPEPEPEPEAGGDAGDNEEWGAEPEPPAEEPPAQQKPGKGKPAPKTPAAPPAKGKPAPKGKASEPFDDTW